MYISVVSIGTDAKVHSKWGVQEHDNKNTEPKSKMFFFESEDKDVLQKIKIGGPNKMFPSDYTYAGDIESIGEGYVSPEVFVQSYKIPFGKAYVNPKNLNPFIAGIGDSSTDRLIVVILDKNMQYIRSAINHSVGEIISTFTTQEAIGCIIKVSEKDFDTVVAKELSKPETVKTEDISVITFDVFNGKSFEHFRIHLTPDTTVHEVKVVESTVRNANLIKRLKQLNDNYKGKINGRRFVRFTPNIITMAFIVPYPLVETTTDIVLEKHNISDAIQENTEFMLFGVNVDEDGKIKNDKELKKAIIGLKENKIKAFTLVGCKLTKSTFEKVNPLYIFSLDETEDLKDPNDVKTIKSIKSN